MREYGRYPMPPQEGPQVTPEEQAREGKPAKSDYADQSQIRSLKGQKARILRAKWEKLTGSPGRKQPPADVRDF